MKVVPVAVRTVPVPRKRAVREPGDVITECGCVCVPWPVFHILGVKGKDVLCNKHGWQRVVRPATPYERAGLAKIRPLPEEPMF